jgi:glycosyltransferase involved in cell wall biosynthesis
MAPFWLSPQFADMNINTQGETMQRNNDQPACSVILPVYNAGKYLHDAIESVLRQSFTDFELLLLNDGSTDASLQCLESFAAQDPRCHVHSWPNRGLIATLNEGIRLARADIIMRMDADDVCYPLRFEKQMAFLDAHPECVAVGARVRLIDPDGQPLRVFTDAVDHEVIDTAHMSGKGGAIPHPSVAMRKAAIISCGAYRPDYPHAEDIDLFLRLAEIGRLANLPEVLLDYRQHPGSIGYKHAEAQRDSARRAVLEARRRRGLELSDWPVADAEPTVPPAHLSDVHRKWGWWAFSDGNHATARKHALKAFRLKPWDFENIKLLGCILRGH